MNWRKRIVSRRGILAGRPVIKGTRIAVDLLLDLLGMGWSYARVLKYSPSLKREDLHACVAYASEALRSGSSLLPQSLRQAEPTRHRKPSRHGAGYDREMRDIHLIREALHELYKDWTPKQLRAYYRESTKDIAKEFGLHVVRHRRRRFPSKRDPYAGLDIENELDDEELARLDKSIDTGLAEIEAGKGIPGEELFKELRARKQARKSVQRDKLHQALKHSWEQAESGPPGPPLAKVIKKL
jgi:uncharacterized protein (DUF433 family)